MIEKQKYQDFALPLLNKAIGTKRITSAQIELTYACNLKCVHCYTDCYNQSDLIKAREMPTEMILGLLDELAEMGVFWLTFTGGEIFMRKDFREIYLHAKQRGFIIALFTNVTPVTKRVADFLAENPPRVIETSCHGLGEIFDKVTQVPGAFERFEEGLAFLQERRIPVIVKANALTINRDSLHKMRAYVEGRGLLFQLTTKINPRLDGNLEPCDYRLSPAEILAVEGEHEDICEDDECRRDHPMLDLKPPPDDRLYRCGCGTIGIHINAWGELGTCTFFREPRVDLRKRSIPEAVSEVFAQIHGARYESDSSCRGCDIHVICQKMPSIAWAETGGDKEAPVDHFCEVAHLKAGREPREKGAKYG